MADHLAHAPDDWAEDVRLLLLELERDVPGAAATTHGCRPPLDVVETAAALEVVVDVPGAPVDSLRVAVRRNTVLIAGAKPSGPADPDARFHVAERTYGRFARAIHVGGAFDAVRAHAVAGRGQLRIILPRVPERRGRILPIPVTRE